MREEAKQLTKCLEGYFGSILDVLSEGVYISDYTGKTLKVNRVYEQLTGLGQEELLGRNVKELVSEGIYSVALNPEIVKTGEPKTSVQTTKVGRKVILNGFPVFDQSGKVALVVTFVRDVTLLSQLKEQVASQQQLIDRYHNEIQFYPKAQINRSIIAKSLSMVNLLNSLEKIAKTDATVLLLGETGVGKDIIARKIHESSLRVKKPFFKVDCAAIPENLVESELFGYEAGAFSGASSKGKPGCFEMADKGTLFLDEIGELPLLMQGKLLRVLQDQEIMRVGSTKPKKVDLRIIAATNRNLEEAVKEGAFRSDLFYRLRVAVLTIPPLRQRQDDILPLTDYFLHKFNGKYRKKMNLDAQVKQVFQNYNWPGNIRELENLIQSLVVTRDKDTIDISDLPNNMVGVKMSAENRTLGEIISDVERELLQKALATHGSVANIAKLYKVDRTTIFRKLKKYSLI